MKKLIFIVSIISFFVIGLVVGILVSKKTSSTVAKQCPEKYSHINSLLGCGQKFAIKKTGYVDFRYKIETYLEKQKSENKITETSVYFRDLINGPWMGIGEDKTFTPASLLKLPIMLTFLRMADDDPGLLQKKMKINLLPKDVEKQYFKPEKTIEMGEVLTIENLIERMMAYSDNRASGVLLEYLYRTSKEKDPLVSTLRETGTLRSESKPFDEISVKAYASLFRMLFNSSYLSNEMSERALEILSRAEFKDGIVSGVPSGINVAHKFGERDIDDGLNQLHDCGIVYFPQNPYLICVMTRGKDFKQLSGIVKEISKMIYDEVNSRKIKP